MNFKDVFEALFNVMYLVIMWTLVVKMIGYAKKADGEVKHLSKILITAFALLALGDTGHVGFRVIAYLNGGIDANLNLVGMGKFSTSITITIFYMVLLFAWKARFKERFSVFTSILLTSGIIRLFILLCPANDWGNPITPFNFAMYRNIPLWILGLGVVYLFLKNAFEVNDSVFKWMAYMIICSYAFYTPVVLFAHKLPAIGALMIPKTIAYMVVAFVAYKGIFKRISPAYTKGLSQNS